MCKLSKNVLQIKPLTLQVLRFLSRQNSCPYLSRPPSACRIPARNTHTGAGRARLIWVTQWTRNDSVFALRCGDPRTISGTGLGGFTASALWLTRLVGRNVCLSATGIPGNAGNTARRPLKLKDIMLLESCSRSEGVFTPNGNSYKKWWLFSAF